MVIQGLSACRCRIAYHLLSACNLRQGSYRLVDCFPGLFRTPESKLPGFLRINVLLFPISDQFYADVGKVGEHGQFL